MKKRVVLNILLMVSVIIITCNIQKHDKVYADDNEYQGVEIVTEDNVVPLDKNSSKNTKNVSMGEHEDSEEEIQLFSLERSSGPYWKNENGVKNFYNGEGNLMYHEGTKKVIDVSEHNGTVDWEKVKASGIDGVILRVGWGYLGKDKQFDRNIKECNRLNIPYGIYLYSYAYDSNFAYHEAEGTIEMLNNYDINLSYPIYYDIEAFKPWNDNGVTRKHPSNPSEYEQVILTYINRMNQEPKYKDKVHVYSYRSYLYNQLNSSKIHQYVSWAAEYGNTLKFQNHYYNGEEGWQYSSTGSVDGIHGNVDMNCFSNQFYNTELSTTISQSIRNVLNELNINYTNGYISGISVGTDISSIIQKLSTVGKVSYLDKNGSAISSGVVATGQKIIIVQNNITYTMETIIRGDVNGDGKISAIDYVKIRNKLDGKKTLNTYEVYGADVNLDGKITAIDYVKIRNQLDGRKSIIQK